MSLAVISIDTNSQECVLTIDGALVSANDIYFSKYTNYDGVSQKDFSYSVEVTEPDGMMKRMMHTMVHKDSPEYSSENSGLVAKEIKDKDRLYEEVEAFITKNTENR